MTPVEADLTQEVYFKIGITPGRTENPISKPANPFNRIDQINKGRSPGELEKILKGKGLEWNWQIYCFWEFDCSTNKALVVEGLFRDSVDNVKYKNGISRCKPSDYYLGLINEAEVMSSALVSGNSIRHISVNCL
jgi:hypothetical protein